MPPQDVLRRLGRRIRTLRDERELTQEELAERAKITWHYVSAIERGLKAATVETLSAIAEALDMSLSELFLGVDQAPPRDLRRLMTAFAGRPVDVQQKILRLIEDALALAPGP